MKKYPSQCVHFGNGAEQEGISKTSGGLRLDFYHHEILNIGCSAFNQYLYPLLPFRSLGSSQA